MHTAAFSYIAAHIPAGTRSVLEFGSRNINGTVRDLVPTVRYVGVDIAAGDGVDLVADAATVELDERFDLVVCAEVFEHARNPVCSAMITNAYRHLADGGTVIVTAAGPGRAKHSAIDGGPLQPGEFYRNVKATLLASWLTDAGFTAIDVDTAECDVRATAVKA